MGIPVWISGPNRRITYVNDKAEGLLGTPADSCLGQACFRVMRGRDAEGEPFCSEECPLRRTLRAEREIVPVTVRVGDPERHDRDPLLLMNAQPDGHSAHSFQVVDDRVHTVDHGIHARQTDLIR